MREEASLEEWRELYQLGIKIQKLEPWNYLWDTNIITIRLSHQKEPYFCNITGRGTDNFSINVFLGYEGFYCYLDIAQSQETGIPIDYIMFEQLSLSCYFTNKEEVPYKQRKVIKNLGLKFHGKQQWIYFESHKKGYMPYILDKEETILLIDCYNNLYAALSTYINNKSLVCFEKGETLLREYNVQQKMWVNYGIHLPISERKYSIIRIQDENIKRELKKQPFTDRILELDLIYTHIYVQDRPKERRVNPKLLLAIDSITERIINEETFTPEEDEIPIVLNVLVEFIKQYGRIKKIYLRNLFLESIIKDTCEYCGIVIERRKQLKAVDEFRKEFQRLMNHSSFF